MANVNSMTFLKIGNRISKTKASQKPSIKARRFKAFFGVTPYVCALVWRKIHKESPVGFQPKHLLWGMNFLKQYTVEEIRHSILRADEKTIRKWTWASVKLMSKLNVIIWENRKHGSVNGQTAFCSLDGVDFRILEPTPFSPRWFSHKFHGPGLRYEVGLCIRTGHIVWEHGGYPCGEFSDLTIAREAYVLSVDRFEKTLADRGYRDANFFILKNSQNISMHGKIMARHETVNRRLRQFQVLKQTFRHDLQKHPMVFSAVANLTQLMLENGEPLFGV